MRGLIEKQIEGVCAEVGVYQGEFARYINRFLPDKKLYLFDTFEGFRDVALEGKEQQIKHLDLFVDTTPEAVMKKMEYPTNCIIKKGIFPETAQGIEEKFVLVSLDADLFQPIYDGLAYFEPRMVSGGAIFVHDYGLSGWPGVKQAVDKYCSEKQLAVLPLTDKCMSCIILKNKGV